MTTLSTDAEFQIPVHTHLSDNGIREKVKIPASKPYISLIGNQNAANQTVITWGDKAFDIAKDDTVLGTYRSASVTVLSDYLCAAGITFEVHGFVLHLWLVKQQKGLLPYPKFRTVPVSCFETPTRADKICQQLSHSTQGSGSHSSANEASLMCENAYLNTAARIQQHIAGQQINNTRRVNLLNHYTPANTTTQTSPDTEITVPVPELDKIGVRRTVWYSDEASHGPRNLLNSFNKVGENSGSGRTDIGKKNIDTCDMKCHAPDTIVRAGLSEDCHGPEFESTSTNNNGT
uniref:Uncharacterized protein n=1 Tax=Daucus carota subsp. sativus TaxID=79200 RepID=A0A175YG53_DAUCS